MTKEELAENYANEQASEFANKIKEAYLKGYEQGELKSASTINIDGVEYVDLGLPSGTLWSSHPLEIFNWRYHSERYQKMGWQEAQKLNIPTFEQLEELVANRVTYLSGCCVYAIGPNSNRIYYDYESKGEGIEDKNARKCWIKSEAINNKGKAHLIFKDSDGICARIVDYFTGYKLPVFLVKNKADL